MAISLSQELANFSFISSLERIPSKIRCLARQHLLDIIGCCIAALKLDTTNCLRKYLLSEHGAQQSTAIGVSQLLPASQAAFMNGLLARSLEFDDMAMPDLHPSGVIIPVVLALSELTQKSGPAIITAISIGLELCIRLGRAGIDSEQQSLFLQRGQDSTAICGAVSGAAVAAKLLDLNKEEIANAIGIAISLASGSLEANRSGGNIKQFQSGWAAK